MHLQMKDPLFIRMQKEREREVALAEDGQMVTLSSTGNARMALASLVDGNYAQAVILVLILLDVVCVILELLLVATKCPCLQVYPDDETANAYGSSYYGSNDGSSYYGSNDGSSYGSSYGESTSYESTSYGSGDSRRLRVVDWMAEHLGMGDPDDWGDIVHTVRRLAGEGVPTSCIKRIDGKRNNFKNYKGHEDYEKYPDGYYSDGRCGGRLRGFGLYAGGIAPPNPPSSPNTLFSVQSLPQHRQILGS